jgi:50S ribosome-binding GTPase
MTDYATWSERIRQFENALTDLERAANSVGVEPADGQGWCDLLRVKLLPQLDSPPLLIVGVVGGTNIGKSVVFNHLAGEVASAVSPLAAGTKHPVCLTPPEMDDADTLAKLFESFQLKAWQSAEDALVDSDENRLFWRTGRNVPQKLLLLDAPDIDSDAVVNWERAKAIRQAADVLIAVLTQQKYNDAAVKRFFREAVRADKPVIVVFNQCDLEADREYWPEWLATFCTQTGAEPELVYVIPQDRAAADELELPFFNVGLDGRADPENATSLRDELAALHFDAVKIRTFRGALDRVLDPQHGAPDYLETIRAASSEYSSAAESLSAAEMARVAWPTLPSRVLVDEIRDWWDAGRAEWSRNIHGFYRKIGQGITWPVRAAWQASQADDDPVEPFRREENRAIVLAVEKMLDELRRLATVGNDTLRPRLAKLLGGDARAELLARIRQAHRELPAVDDDYRAFLRAELDAWREGNPRAVRFLRSLDHVAALARPAITITLAISGFMVAGDLVGQAAVHAAGQTAGGLATEAAIAGGITGGGEAAISTAGEGVRQAAGRLFSRLQSHYTQSRAQWLAAWLERELLGDLLIDLRTGAELPESATFVRVKETLEALGQGE